MAPPPGQLLTGCLVLVFCLLLLLRCAVFVLAVFFVLLLWDRGGCILGSAHLAPGHRPVAGGGGGAEGGADAQDPCAPAAAV